MYFSVAFVVDPVSRFNSTQMEAYVDWTDAYLNAIPFTFELATFISLLITVFAIYCFCRRHRN